MYSSFKDNIWGDDLAVMQLTSKCKKEVKFLISATESYSKYACVT